MRKALAIVKNLALVSTRQMLGFPIARRILYTRYEQPAIVTVVITSLAMVFVLGYAYRVDLFINPWEQGILIDIVLAVVFVATLLSFVLSPTKGLSLPPGYEFLLHQPVDLGEIALGVTLGVVVQNIVMGIFLSFIPLVVAFVGATLGLLPGLLVGVLKFILMLVYVGLCCILLALDLELLKTLANRGGRGYVLRLAQALILIYMFTSFSHSFALSLDLGSPTVSPILLLPIKAFYIAAYEVSNLVGFAGYLLGLATMVGVHYPLVKYLGRSLGVEDFVSVKEVYEMALLKQLEKEVKRRPLASWSSPEDALRQILLDLSPLNPHNKLKHYTVAFIAIISVALILRLLIAEGVLTFGGYPGAFISMVIGFSVMYIYIPLVKELLFNDLRSLWLIKVYSCNDLPFVKILNIKYLSYLVIALSILSLFKAVALNDPYLLLLPVLNLPLLYLSANMFIVFGARYLRKHKGKPLAHIGTPSVVPPDIHLALLMSSAIPPIVGQSLFTSLLVHRILDNTSLTLTLTLCVSVSVLLTTKLTKLVANWLTKAELY